MEAQILCINAHLAYSENVQEAIALHQDDFSPQAGLEAFPPRQSKLGSSQGTHPCMIKAMRNPIKPPKYTLKVNLPNM